MAWRKRGGVLSTDAFAWRTRNDRFRNGGLVNVIGYVRVSTEEQAESGAGMDAQRLAIEAECARRGWDLLRIEEDAASATAATVSTVKAIPPAPATTRSRCVIGALS